MEKKGMTPNAALPLFGAIRTDGYVLLASLLGRPPSTELRGVVSELAWPDTLPQWLDHSLAALQSAARELTAETIETEYRHLFDGPGNGEIIPYASWYLEGKIQSRSLAELRSDLYRLGIVKQTLNPEPEDHVAALCETMSIMAQAHDEFPLPVQARFFARHLSGWIGAFFRDLSAAHHAVFYRAVGACGADFMQCESRFLGCYPLSTVLPRRRFGYEHKIFREPADLS